MKQKALKTLDAAQKLINAQLYTQSVHCSYYAILQYMKYMLATTTVRPIPYAQQNDQPSMDSHTYILREVRSRLSNNTSIQVKFEQSVQNLRHLRVEADYTIKEFTAEESAEARQFADGIITKLKTFFGNI